MGGGKSSKLIQDVYNFRQNNVIVEVLKPSFDNRWSSNKIESRIGSSVECNSVPDFTLYEPKLETNIIVVDEAQFLKKKEVDHLVRISDEQLKTLMFYGLLINSNEELFEGSKRIVEKGAKLHELKTSCQCNGCQNVANHHVRYVNNKPYIGGTGVAIGDNSNIKVKDFYKSVCRFHYNELTKGIKR